MLQPFKGEKPPPKRSIGRKHWAGIQKVRFLPHKHALPFVFPSPVSSQLQAKYSLESANILNMCPKGKQWDAEKWLCHIRHISLTVRFSHPLTSAGSSQISLSSAIRIWSVATPLSIFFPTEPHLACSFNQLCRCPAFIPSRPWPCRVLTPQLSKFVTTGIKFSCLVVSTWSSHASRFVLLLRFASFHWLLHFYPCFPSYLLSHFYSFSPPQLPSLKFPFLKYAVSLKAFIINLSRNYLRASSAVLWFIRCAVFLASISQELSWSSFYLHS